MEDTDWAATGVFSPSKARIAERQAKDWSFVDAWLAKRYASGRVPAFERNEDTLRALLALISLSEAADQRRLITERVERSALQFYTKLKNEPADALYKDLSDRLNINAQDGLEALAQSSLLLSTPTKNGIAELTGAAIHVQTQAFETRQADEMAASQVQALEAKHARLKDVIAHVQGAFFKPPQDMIDETSQWIKGTKHLRAKLSEYDERLATTRPSRTLPALLDEITKANLECASCKAQLNHANADLQAVQDFNNRPSEIEAALRDAKAKLQRLRAQREVLLST